MIYCTISIIYQNGWEEFILDINFAVSQNIKRAREEKKLTLDAAAAVTGVSRSMLAQIERGEANPTISVLWKIANGYKVSFTSLIERLPECASVIISSEVTPMVEDEGRYINYPVFSFDEEKLFETYRILIEPMGRLEADSHLAGTEEYITVFQGRVQISVNGEIFFLNEGDSIRFKADAAHSYKNIGDQKAQLSMIIYYGK